MNERLAPVLRDYQRYVELDHARSAAQRVEKQSAAVAAQKLHAQELLRFRRQPAK